MLYHPKRLYLLALLPTALAGKSADVTKTFKFTDAFFIKFDPLSTAIGPDNVGVLMSALDGFAKQFKEVWTEQIESTLQGGDCTVNQMKLPEFSMCDWKYPNLYDVDELPTPGQCYEYENGFVSSMFFFNHSALLYTPPIFASLQSFVYNTLISKLSTHLLQDQQAGNNLPRRL
mmetsp:Transcript_27218/g.58327  ORF Transcript_27218/g.58327 Transcript_27218/m.58327 type:complete len:174 (+) Transcript_27218:279-800(+)